MRAKVERARNTFNAVHFSASRRAWAKRHDAALRHRGPISGEAVFSRLDSWAPLAPGVNPMIRHKDKLAFEILGSPDDVKFRSFLTLFS
jgi:hypothetical protein